MTAEKQRQDNREKMPTIAKVYDDMRRIFGPGIKLRHAEENGHTIDKPRKEGETC